LDGQDEVNEGLCSLTKSTDDSVPSWSNFQYSNTNSARMDTAVGISLNGVPLFNGMSAEMMDPFYPNQWSGSSDKTDPEIVDGCNGHP